MRRLARQSVAAALIVGALTGVASLRAETRSGTLPDGSAYRIDKPDNWNGIVLADLDYAGMGDNPRRQALAVALLERGYGLAGTTRVKTGWRVENGVANVAASVDQFEQAFAKPKFAVVFGSSLGGHTAATAMNMMPTRFDAAVSMCSAPAGTVAVWNAKFDLLFLLKTLLAPQSDLPIIDVPADFRTKALPDWLAMLRTAQASPEGRARIALAGAIAQLPDWADPAKPEPAEGDVAARQDGLYDSIAAGPLPVVGQALSSRSTFPAILGGNISSNVGIDYGAILAKVRDASLVRALYAQAGLSLDADLAALARAPRIKADPEAVARTRQQQFTGRLPGPVITMHNIGDPIAPVEGAAAYEKLVTAAGRAPMLRQVYVRSAGHCAFSVAETVAVAEALRLRLETGRWGDTSAAGMTKLAARSGAGASRFITYRPVAFARAMPAPR